MSERDKGKEDEWKGINENKEKGCKTRRARDKSVGEGER